MAKRFQGGILGVGFNPLQAPNAPTIGTATAGNTTASVPFTAPANVGGSAITSYAVQSDPGGIGASGASSPITVSGLTNGTAYTFRVTALNSYGPSPASGSSNSVTPVPPVGWIGTLTSSVNIEPQAIGVDGSGNVYIAGDLNQNGGDIFLAKYNSQGAVQWQRSLGASDVNSALGIAVDSSGNVHVNGYTQRSGAGNWDFIVAKYDTSGTLQWQRIFGRATGGTFGYSIALDSSSNVYALGNSNANFSDRLILVKYDASGTLQWAQSFASGITFGNGVAVSSSGDIYCSGSSRAGTSIYKIQIVKFNSSGVLQWQRRLGPTGNAYGNRGIAVDSSGNAYVTGGTDLTGAIAKYDTSGNFQWQREFASNTVNDLRSVVVGSDGSIYACGSNTSSSTELQIVKYNSSGALQWQRSLGISTALDYGNSITADASGNFYVCGRTTISSLNSGLIAKLPGSGAFTGTYTVGSASVVYATTAFSELSGTMTSVSSSGSSGDPSYLSGDTAFLSSSTPTLTSTVAPV